MLKLATFALFMLSPVLVSPCDAAMSELIFACASFWFWVCACRLREMSPVAAACA